MVSRYSGGDFESHWSQPRKHFRSLFVNTMLFCVMDAIAKDFTKRAEATWKSFSTFDDSVLAKRTTRACDHL
jgi:hypothetical protein